MKTRKTPKTWATPQPTVIFAWDTCVYTPNQGPEPEPDLYPGGGGGNDDGNGGVDVGQGGGESEGVGEAG